MAEKELAHAGEFNELDRAVAFKVLALNGGNYSKAARALKSEGRPIHPDTLQRWREETYPVEYETIVEEMRSRISSHVSDGAMETAVNAQEVTGEMIARLQENLHEVPIKDLPKAALNMAQTSRTNAEVARLLRNEPTSIVEVRTIDESLDVLRDLDVIDVTAEEVEDAEVVE